MVVFGLRRPSWDEFMSTRFYSLWHPIRTPLTRTKFRTSSWYKKHHSSITWFTTLKWTERNYLYACVWIYNEIWKDSCCLSCPRENRRTVDVSVSVNFTCSKLETVDFFLIHWNISLNLLFSSFLLSLCDLISFAGNSYAEIGPTSLCTLLYDLTMNCTVN